MSEKIIETRKFIFCQGIPASGKSTWAKDWVKQNEYSRVRINRYDIRNMLGTYWLKDPVERTHRENYITQIERAAIKNALMVGYDIVSDNMNLNPEFYHQTMDFVNDVCTKYILPYKCTLIYSFDVFLSKNLLCSLFYLLLQRIWMSKRN